MHLCLFGFKMVPVSFGCYGIRILTRDFKTSSPFAASFNNSQSAECVWAANLV